MAKIIHFIPQAYMILCMTLSISFIHYIIGHTENFLLSWLGALVIAAPLAIFFSLWIPAIMKRLNHGKNPW
ncbi:MAG: DUF2798 domain-containing protein [Rickettsiales bacterium]|jgi:hypothetical protein|nr:DUF2798 domain-containing protein [Rickettsiales bacterium]